MEGSPPDLASLRAKYEEMLRLRLEHLADLERTGARGDATTTTAPPGAHLARSEAGNPRAAMAALASRFPGALRELDELPIEEIRARIAALAVLEDHGAGASPPWVVATDAFHQLTRGALLAKRWLAGRKVVHDGHAETFVRDHPGEGVAADAEAWRHHLARVAAPPRGRLTELVYERVASRLGVSVAEVRGLIFGHRRR